MHWQQSRKSLLAGLILGLLSSGFAVGHAASGGNGSAGHSAGHGRGHHRASWHGERGSERGSGRWKPSGGQRGWNLPGYGFFFASIPLYCKLIYWNGMPYYTADDVYYEWNARVGAYEQVQPPAGLAEIVQAPVSKDLFVFPNGDQTVEQLARDREDCQRWAAEQVGLEGKPAANRADYLRADGACLEARDYSVEY